MQVIKIKSSLSLQLNEHLSDKIMKQAFHKVKQIVTNSVLNPNSGGFWMLLEWGGFESARTF